jgi:hypothetical protein
MQDEDEDKEINFINNSNRGDSESENLPSPSH